MLRTFGSAVFRSTILSVIVLLISTDMAAMAKSVGLSILGSSFPVAADPKIWEWNHSIAYDESRRNYLVAYWTNSGINAICLNQFGEQQAHYDLGSGDFPDVVYNIRKDQYLVVWNEFLSTNMEIFGAFIRGDCSNDVGSMVRINGAISGDSPGDKFGPAVAYNHHENHQDYLVVWENIPPTGPIEVRARRVTSLGLGLDGSFDIKSSATADHMHPDVAYNLSMNEYLVVYTHKDISQGATSDIYGRRVYNAGTQGVLPEKIIDSSANDQGGPAVAAYRLNKDTPYLVVYRDNWNDPSGDVRGYLLNKEGVPQLLLNLATTSGVRDDYPAIGMSDCLGGYFLAWIQFNDLSTELHVRRVHNTGILEPDELVTELPTVIHEAALANGPVIPLITWVQDSSSGTDIYGQFLWSRHVFLPLMVR